jgi:hypothetical protein
VKAFWLTSLLLFAAIAAGAGPAPVPEYSIQAIRYADSPGDAVADMVTGAPKSEKIDTVYVIWSVPFARCLPRAPQTTFVHDLAFQKWTPHYSGTFYLL